MRLAGAAAEVAGNAARLFRCERSLNTSTQCSESIIALEEMSPTSTLTVTTRNTSKRVRGQNGSSRRLPGWNLTSPTRSLSTYLMMRHAPSLMVRPHTMTTPPGMFCTTFIPPSFGWSGKEFCRRIKHERRFFDQQGQGILSTILGDRESIGRQDNPLSACVVALQTGEHCFRARRADTEEAASPIVRDPRRLLSTPPPHLTPAGRMNPAGIPVFYGGFSEDICTAEVRPYVGGLVVVGEFRTTHRLRLLDLTMLDEHGFAGSMFQPDFYERVTRRLFLRSFHNLISRSVQPHEEVLEYLPTQAVAEYIANVL